MPEPIATAILITAAFYASIGAAVGVWLLAGGLRRIDPQAQIAPLPVKALWLPGLIALWPILIARAVGVRPAEDRS